MCPEGAYLKAVFNTATVIERLGDWTDDNPNEIVIDVMDGRPRLITDMNMEECKRSLEADGAAHVEIR